MLTLPDYLQPGLDLVFVGINPGLYSAQRGEYFARKTNRFWPAFNAAGFTREPLTPATGKEALNHGIGFTDVVKRATGQMAELKTSEFKTGATALEKKLLQYEPRFICFNGLSGYKHYLRFTTPEAPIPVLGLQLLTIARSRVYVMPSTSAANAAVPLSAIVAHLQSLKRLLQEERTGRGRG